MSAVKLTDWLGMLGIKGALPLVAAAAVAAPMLEAEAGSRAEGQMIVINHEEQYSIWPKGVELPSGWESSSKAASAAKALETLSRKVETTDLYVVINHEEQYSIWPVRGESVPRGWEKVSAETCSVQDCLKSLEQVSKKLR